MFITLLRCLRSRTLRTLRRAPPPRRWPFLPRPEVLEDRTVPSTFTIANLLDSGAGSLRAAIAAANAAGGANTIDFAPGLTGTITLTSGALDVTANLTIAGPGSGLLAVSGNNASRVFQVAANSTVAMTGLTIENGNVSVVGDAGAGIDNLGTLTLSNCSIANNIATGLETAYGGGILNRGTLTIQNCLITGNTDRTVGGGGGGVANYGSLTVLSSTLSGNLGDAGSGGGFLNTQGTSAIGNSTFAGNSADEGGGIAIAAGAVTLRDCTISNNSAGEGGGIANLRGTVSLGNTLVAGNLGSPVNTPPSDVFGGSFKSLGYNLIGIGGEEGGLTNGINHDQVGTLAKPIDPLLGSLQNNGGPTQTMALLPGSPAINAGNANALGLPAYDQRGPGYARVVEGQLDIGAFEVQTR